VADIDEPKQTGVATDRVAGQRPRTFPADDAARFQAALLDAAPEAIIAIDQQLRITYCNAGTESLLQRTRSETIGERAVELIAPDRRADIERIEHLLTSGLEIRDFETVIRRADGTDVDVSLSVTSQTTPTSKISGSIAIVRDITERARLDRVAAAHAARAASAERRAAGESRERAAAERANQAKSELVTRLSHDLRTPLNSVLGFAQLLDDADLSDPIDRHSVEQVLTAGRRLVAMVDELLESSEATDRTRRRGAEPPSDIEAGHLVVVDRSQHAPADLPIDVIEDRELSILYVDEDPTHLRAVEAVVAARGNVVLVTTAQARRGLELAHALRPDLLLLSAGLADLATSEALAQLRADGTLESTCVMVVNALARHETPCRGSVERTADAANPMGLGRLVSLVDGLATSRFTGAPT
jgi:PAS domain S-box-containing protein